MTMKQYTGTKTILARPMTLGDYNDYRGWDMPENENPANRGFLVEYEPDGKEGNHPDHKGYISWSPEDVFEKAYRLSGSPLDRLQNEKRDLDAKKACLTAFIGTDVFDGLKLSQQHWMHAQYELMKQYSAILEQRINYFDDGAAVGVFNFGQAVALVKAGHRMQRLGWNGTGMFIFLVPGSKFNVNRPPLLGIYEEGTEIKYNPHIDLKGADGSVSTWSPSNGDALAEDWIIFKD